MNSEILIIWQEVKNDFHSVVFLWQLAIITVSLVFAWSVNGMLRAYVMKYSPERWKVGIGGINRVLFPLSSLLFVYIGHVVLNHWQSNAMLQIVITLLLAMAVIRLAVYALRYIFSPSSWVQTLEHAIAGVVWLMLALHLSGLLPDILNVLDSIKIGVAKSQMSLLLIIQAILIILVTLFVALWISRLIENRLMETPQINMNVRVVMSKIVRIFFSLIAILMALSAVGLDITLLSVFGGALGVGLGFGLQKIASNYVSGFIILMDESIHIGDFVTIDKHYGKVNELRSRYMVLRKGDNTKVIIPNEALVTNIMMNHSMSDRNSRIQLSIQVGYDSDLELAMKLLLESARIQDRVLQDPAPTALINTFAESGVELLLNVWINDPENGTAGLQSEIYLDIWRSFKKNNISIPYPQREVRLVNPAPASSTS